jgi:hypothetical protein
MSKFTINYRSFHPLIADAYTNVHEWLATKQAANGYRQLHFNNIREKLEKTDLMHIAFQYYALFPTHYFKVAHILDTIVTKEQLLRWLNYKPRLCVLDIGCGAGAASVAFLEAVINLKKQGLLSSNVDIFCLGLDPNSYALILYQKLIEQIKESILPLGINLDFKGLYQGFPNAIYPVTRHLKHKLELWQRPCLSNVIVMQLNVISPLSKVYNEHQKTYEQLKNLGLDSNFIVESFEEFGLAEALAYKQLLEDVPIDIMHILTIGTKNMEMHVQVGTNSTKTLEERIQEMAASLNQVFRTRHTIEQNNAGNHRVYFENPINSYWKDRNNPRYHTDFYADFQTIINANFKEDKDWNSIISLENLQLAWVRARYNLLFKEALCDETEIRLFEENLDERIAVLQQQLLAYADDIALTDDCISYKFPKNISNTRPRALTRIEEEILSVAIIQKLGNKLSRLRGRSYAYRISPSYGNRDTEYLYEYWFNAYSSFIKSARNSAENHMNGAVLRVDIESYYTRIIQEVLCSELSKELTESERVRWLLRILLSKELNEHETGYGITQGSIGSGFYANVYLTSIDAKFGSGNQWGVEFFRYVDDMILIIPDPEDIDNILRIVNEELGRIGLNINDSKTEKFFAVSQFLEETNEDQLLDKLSERYECVVNPLWIMDSEKRVNFKKAYRNDEIWWDDIERYKHCLRAINIHITETELSRKVYKYLFSPKSREKALNKRKEILGREGELKLAQLPNDESVTAINDWFSFFASFNLEWMIDRETLRKDLIKLFQESWEQLRQADSRSVSQERKLQRYIRFAIYRLTVLSLEEIRGQIVEILQEAFWIIREPSHVIESFARQGYQAEIINLLLHYKNSTKSVEYLRSVTLRAMRFLPNINAQEWEDIVHFATILDGSVSVAEKLMATETWLYLGHKYNNFKQNHHINAVKDALRSEPPPPTRLQKNYLLILGQFESNALQEFPVNSSDLMLRDARNRALAGNPSDIFDLPELSIIRQNYYGGQGATDREEGTPT